MLKKLHIKLTLICTLITSIILVTSSVFINCYLEKQLNKNEYSKFETSCCAIYNELKSQKHIKYRYITKLYNKTGICIYLKEDNNFLPDNDLYPLDNSAQLISNINAIAYYKYNFDISNTLKRSNNYKSINFKTKDSNRNKYYVSCGIVSTKSSDTNISVILIYSLNKYKHKILYERLLFIFVNIIGIISLYIFSYIFTKKTLKPIDESQKRQAHFIAAASHELRSPLAVIISSSQALDKCKEEDREKFIHNITSESNRMATLVNDMLQLANANNNTLKMNFNLENLDTILIDVYEMFEYISITKGIKLEIDLPDYEIPKIKCDKGRIIQVLSILINNALNYCKSNNGKIILKAKCIGKTVQLFVIDNGNGISNEDKKHIFEPFYRVDSAHNDKEHFGLGLSIAYKIIILNKGKLSVMDTIGGGTTFIITFNT